MRVETQIGGAEISWSKIPEYAKHIERVGYDRVTANEVTRDPLVMSGILAQATTTLGIATSIMIAFPRSPMVTALAARNIHDLSGGRFNLGLGTQVKGHIERRFGMEFSPPAPRFREYVEAIRAAWDTWDNKVPLDYQGEYYKLSLMTPEFDPGPNRLSPIPIQLAAMNRQNLLTVGKLCDAIRIHKFTTLSYINDVIIPTIVEGAELVGRSREDVEIIGCGFLAAGATEEAVHEAREVIRRRVAWYSSTPAYLPVLQHHDRTDIFDRTHALVRERHYDDLPAAIDDEALDLFCAAATYSDLPELLASRFGGVVDTVAVNINLEDANHDELAVAISEIQKIPTTVSTSAN